MSSSSHPPSNSPAKVQQVSKASSDELLRKFAAQDECPAPTPGKISRSRPSLHVINRRSLMKPESIHELNEILSDGGFRIGGRVVGKTAKRKRSVGCQVVAECKALLPGSHGRLSLPAIRSRHRDAEFAGIGRLLASVEKVFLQ
ncbi:hypothetical protein KSP40_PGU002485 [Platanthera guangdongensis]|uniref:Uncharacterized protein n=1 Tax=Platanthera guangdongensis TaxID=2320717 RepID=A0ABR2M1X2_9ASPA